MTNEQRKINKLLIKVKYNAYKLKDGGQLPSFLYKKIVLLGIDDEMEKVKFYMLLAETYLRVKGYYQRFPETEKVYEQEVNKLLKERGYE